VGEAKTGALLLARSVYNEKSRNIVLRPDQMEMFRNKEHLIKVACCGRRYGKTTYCLAEALEGAGRPGSLVWWTAPTYGQLDRPRIVMEYICRQLGILDEPTRFFLKLKNGSQISFRSVYDSGNLLGAGVNRLIMDEAKLFRERDFGQVLMPMLMDTHGDCIMVSTPAGPRGFFYNMFQAGQPGPKRHPDVISFTRPSQMNPLNDERWLHLQKELLGKYYAQEILAKFVDVEEFDFVFDGGTMKQFFDYKAIQDSQEALAGPAILAIDGSGVGKVGWVAGNGSRIHASGAETMPRPDYLYDFTEQKIIQHHPRYCAVDSTAGNTGLYPYIGKWCRERREAGHYAPEVIGCNFSWLPKEPQRYDNWRTENLFLTRDIILRGQLVCKEADSKDLLRQMEMVRSRLTDKGRFRAMPKKHKGEEHSEDTVDALIMYVWTLVKYGMHSLEEEPEEFDINELYRRTARKPSRGRIGKVLIA